MLTKQQALNSLIGATAFLMEKYLDDFDARLHMANLEDVTKYVRATKEVLFMPKGYEKMRDSFKREGMSDGAAKTKAAKIWNSKHPNNPVTRGSDKKKK